jgi:hypothetical protein
MLDRFSFLGSNGCDNSLLDEDMSDMLECFRCRFCEDLVGRRGDLPWERNYKQFVLYGLTGYDISYLLLTRLISTRSKAKVLLTT